MSAVATDSRSWRDRRAILRLAVVILALLGCGDDPTAVTPACDQAPRLVSGEPVRGQLSDDDARRAGVPIDYHSLLISDSGVLIVELTATGFDPFLYLLEETGEPMAQAFDRDGGVETVTLMRAMGAGCYLVGVSGWSPRSRGEYLVTLHTPPDG